MLHEFHCEGAPRDLGLDQGRACRDDLRARFVRSPFWERFGIQLGVDGKRSSRLARDLKRYFPQQSEALEGMVRGSEVPQAWLVSRLDRELGADVRTRIGAASAMAADASRSGGVPIVARTLDCEPVIRYSRPDGGFASVELTLPWFTSALAGVNEGGLAATWVSLPGGLVADGCTAPAALLIQDCLARFDSIRGAADWCTGRPCGGRAVILLADAGGDVTALEVDGPTRRMREREAGMVFAGDATDAVASLHAEAKPDLETVAKVFGGRIAGIDPAGRRVALLDSATGGGEWFEIRLPEERAADHP
jgi:hypothetical protein